MKLFCLFFLIILCQIYHVKCYINTYNACRGNSFVLLPSLRSCKVSRVSLYSTNAKVVEPFGKGLMEDVKRKLPHYKSDFVDGINMKTVSSVFFLFYACIAPAIAFGGVLGAATNGLMGSMETITATALGGILYSLFAGQPLTIIGTTGPLLAFIKVLFDACAQRNIPFLPVYAWTGLWSSLILMLSALFSTSNVVEYFTKFTDDIFSSLISVIFIAEAAREILKSFRCATGLEAFVSTSVTLATFLTANSLSKLRNSQYFPRSVRSSIADFAPVIGVATGLATSVFASSKYQLSLPTLAVPSLLSTTTGRSWLVDIWSVSDATKLWCILPAIMASILLFMDQNITVRLIMDKQNKLKKGSGIHLDMFVVSITTAICSLLGLPHMVAATVRSTAHVRSLKQYSTVENDETQATVVFEGVQEQRLSGLSIHALIALSILYGRSYLRKIPVSVVTGVFLYLGISSIDKTDLFQRTRLFVMDDRDAPKSSISLGRRKLFTSIQLALLAAMWWMKSTKLGVFFPVLIGGLAPIRIMLEKFNIFSKQELEQLDGEIA